MNSSTVDLIVDILQSPTQRYIKSRLGVMRRTGMTPNLGLSAYIGEAMVGLLLSLDDSAEVERYRIARAVAKFIDSLDNESQEYCGYRWWGWERCASVPGISFPLDWDDTSKAVDVIRSSGLIAKDIGAESRSLLPPEAVWLAHLEASRFRCEKMGYDYALNCPYLDALSVFFGPNSVHKPSREDLMVTVVTARTTALWYYFGGPSVRETIVSLLRRVGFGINHVLSGNISFSSLSRYYFSAGHCLYRLIETMDILDIRFSEIDLSEIQVHSAVGKASLKLESIDRSRISPCLGSELNWWLLVGKRLGLIETPNSDYSIVRNWGSSNKEVVYRHRREGHYYGVNGWSSALQAIEFYRLGRGKHIPQRYEAS